MSSEDKYMKALSLKAIHGIILPDSDIVTLEYLEEALAYTAKDGDTVLLAYSKSGSTWLLYIIWEILHKGEQYHGVTDTYTKYAPSIEVAGSSPVEALEHPRFYKHHTSCKFIKINPKAKYIYIHRRPEDLIVSFYHFSKFYSERKDYDFDFFFEAFMTGKVWYGDYFDHLLSAYEHRNDENFLFLSYEELKANTRSEILRIVEFLGEEYVDAMRKDPGLVDKILNVTSFDHMKKNLVFDARLEEEGNKPVDFFRKGVVGEGKQYLSPEQRERLDAKIKKKLAGTELVEAWLSEK